MDFILYGTLTLCLAILDIFFICSFISNMVRGKWFSAIALATLIAIDIITIINIYPKIIL